jgi:hypothetical protein
VGFVAAAVEIVCTELGVRAAVGEDMVDDHEEAVGESEQRALASAATGDPIVGRAEGRGFGPGGGPAASVIAARSQRFPGRVRPDCRFPALSWLPGQRPAQEAR